MLKQTLISEYIYILAASLIDKFIGASIIADEDLRVKTFNLARFSLQIAPINLS